MNNLVEDGDVLPGYSPWCVYVTSLIIDYHVQPSEAWRMTTREYWMLRGYTDAQLKAQQGAPGPKRGGMTRAEGAELIDKLRERGFKV